MRIGEVVAYQDKRWLVTTMRPGSMALIRAWDGTELEVPVAFDKDPKSGLTVVAEPGKWPFLTVPMRTKAGPVVRVTLARSNQPRELTPLDEWVPSDLVRPGGPIFLNPSLHLERGEVLVAAYKSGKLTRLVVNTGFASVKLRQQRAMKPKAPPPRTVYDRLMSDDDDL